MKNIKIEVVLQINDKDFDKYCHDNRLGISTAKTGIKNMLIDKMWTYVRDYEGLERLVREDLVNTHLIESSFALRGKTKLHKEFDEKERKLQYERLQELIKQYEGE